jgi:hypothetical protein
MIDGGERFTTEDTENAEEGERQKLKGKKFLSLTLPFTLSYSSFFSELSASSAVNPFLRPLFHNQYHQSENQQSAITNSLHLSIAEPANPGIDLDRLRAVRTLPGPIHPRKSAFLVSHLVLFDDPLNCLRILLAMTMTVNLVLSPRRLYPDV